MQKGYYPALFYAIVLHALLIGLLSFSFAWQQFSDVSAAPVLAIEAAVVDESLIEAELAKLEQADERIREAEGQRQRKIDEDAARAREARLAREQEEARLAAVEKQRIEAEKREQQQNELRSRAEQERKIQQQKEAAERAQQEAAEKARLAELEKARQAEEQRVAALAEQRKKDEAARRKAAAEAAIQAEREEQLRRAIAEESARREAEDSGLLDEYKTLISQRIVRNWIQPASAQVGLKCELLLTQIPGGEVTDVQIISCNGDAVVVRSIEAAVFKASPLPPPPDPRLFERKVRVLFEPED
ncbi:MAG: cell envelope integrity protein TolA [Gammaproteobacteria bacterium]|nr:cell envelope integrity protein TolA [Gammaproteobacteria bacterium]